MSEFFIGVVRNVRKLRIGTASDCSQDRLVNARTSTCQLLPRSLELPDYYWVRANRPSQVLGAGPPLAAALM